jgi:pimeloyl-ACP methyl ester carboxylesterase
MLPILLSILLSAVLLLLGAAIAFGTRKRPVPLLALTTAIERLAAMRFPDALQLRARDGTPLAYREYAAANAAQVAVLVHGSIHDSRTMHSIGVLLSKQGVAVYSLDVRGHGGSGRRGDIDYVGQLEDDLVDLVGHSAGGGFTLRFAGSAHGHLFDRYVAVAPFLHHSGEMVKPEAVQWAVAAVPRYTALHYLQSAGIHLFQRLPVLLCAVPVDSDCTTTYSYRLAINFRTRMNWRQDIAGIRAKTTVLVGEEDELFNAAAYSKLLDGLNENVSVQMLKAADHTSICIKASAVMAIRKALV